jgi:hypothetical protein
MTWGIFKSLSKFGKKLGRGIGKIGKKIIHEVPKVIHWVREKAAPVIKKISHTIGDVAQGLAIPAGFIAGPEATAVFEGVALGAKATEKIAKDVEIEKKKPKGRKSHHHNPNPFHNKEVVAQAHVQRPPQERNHLGQQNPLLRGIHGGGIRTL